MELDSTDYTTDNASAMFNGSGSGSASGLSGESLQIETKETTPKINDSYDMSKQQYENVSIHLPPAVFANKNTSSVGVLFSFYTKAALFPLRRGGRSGFPEVVSPVIGALLAGFNSVVNISQNVVMTIPFSMVSIFLVSSNFYICIIWLSFHFFQQQNDSLSTVLECASWDFSAAGEHLYNNAFMDSCLV